MVALASQAGSPPPREAITSAQNAYAKHCAKLRTQGKYRRQTGRAVLVGEEPVRDILASPARHLVASVVVDQEEEEGLAWTEELPGVTLRTATARVLGKMAGVESAAGVKVLAEVCVPPLQEPQSAFRELALQRLLVLDRLQDPGNLGALLRSALALGWQAALLLPGCADPFSDKALKASRGAVLQLPLASGSWSDAEALAKQHGLLCCCGEADHDRGPEPTRVEAPWRGGLALVIGSEGEGVAPAVRRACSPVAVPMPGPMESLNAACAGSILLFALGPSLPLFQGMYGSSDVRRTGRQTGLPSAGGGGL